jgi:hypothetical protein
MQVVFAINTVAIIEIGILNVSDGVGRWYFPKLKKKLMPGFIVG